ncbi:hypothetical protein PHSY_004164 [Pseudozyma hubeiensis SY62]|uniref:Ubiquitin-like modifier HUB1 n=1 Tax=Pseudozyma hubeiensis (strain SY62) TaxID=1305764 RepID=R9P5R2_PSEHS|nr:hypothetical protein PHSY_004164 [Pseudozyma hubeiensis SY62]GAC96582.1 hypothetical protein PHSY_004164 [Pseudozyma hubeiensis SY62]
MLISKKDSYMLLSVRRRQTCGRGLVVWREIATYLFRRAAPYENILRSWVRFPPSTFFFRWKRKTERKTDKWRIVGFFLPCRTNTSTPCSYSTTTIPFASNIVHREQRNLIAHQATSVSTSSSPHKNNRQDADDRVRVKCSPEDTIGDLKKLIAAQTGTPPQKIILKKWYTVYKDHITLADYEIADGFSFEMH